MQENVFYVIKQLRKLRIPIKMLEMPLKSDVLKQPFLDNLVEQFQLDFKGVHGIAHWLRVLINGRTLAKHLDVSIKVIELFALIHDSRRWNNLRDTNHGLRAADFCNALNGKWFVADETEMRLLRIACRYHSDGKLHPNLTVQTCWDADRLDLGRIDIEPDINLLGSFIASKPDLIRSAVERSKKSFEGL